MKNKFLKGLVVSFTLVVSGIANAGLIFRDDVSNSAYTNGSWSFGTIFTVGSDDVYVTSLGAFDYLNDGFTSGSIQVGIFDELSGSLLSSTNVLSSDNLVGSFRYSSITELLLKSGSTYRLVGVSGNDYYDISYSDTFNSAFTNISYGYCSSSTLTICASNSESDYGMASFEFNLESSNNSTDVPEPSTLAIFALGLMGLASRKIKKQA
ncbi:hypothetical protein BM528_12635 [Alteromonas sp. RW2A1]|uniref:PEP-CTERM sorting domain-containing protein n=1 Tax=Alteromonas sp. RW2A1 TaxID=1917158 RepID=UPI000903604A|nr:PEP-CTERM sorting domain-containing protein [Alteromonas sp. RW2A1]APE06508.1 hypothetical protein BM528_12635 [Alteromonas sp. RW2A1]